MMNRPAFLSSDIETAMTLDPRQGPPTMLGFGYGPGLAMSERYTPEHRARYQEMFDKFDIVWHNAMFDIPYLEYYGYEIPSWNCTLLGSHLLHGDLPLGLEFVNSLYVHYPPWFGKQKKDEFHYHATDLDVTWQAWARIETELKAKGLWSLYTKETRPVHRLCMDWKSIGVRVNRSLMERMHLAFTLRLQKIEAALAKVAPINWGSAQQVGRLLYDVWKLPEQFNTVRNGATVTRSRTVDNKAMDNLASTTDNPIPKILQQRRLMEKYISNYTTFPLDENDRWHFDMAFTTATGRARGQIETLPRDTIRPLFLPDEDGWEIAYGDWSQVELWIPAMISQDKHFQEVLSKTKFHMYAAEQVLGAAVSFAGGDKDYMRVKTITHGTGFGRGAKSIADTFHVEISKVLIFQRWMERTFPKWQAYRDNQLEQLQRSGCLTNPFGLTRYAWSGNLKGIAYSFDPQSCVAHMIKRCALQLTAALPKPARLMFTLHDAATICYPPELKEKCLKILQEVMEQPWPELHGWSGKCKIGIGENFGMAANPENYS